MKRETKVFGAIMTGIAAVGATALGQAALGQLTFENLGSPILVRDLAVQAVTPKDDGGYVAWGRRKQESVVGVDIATGKSFEFDMRKYGVVNIAMTPGPNGSLFFYAGNPGRFFRYTPDGKLEELGIPDKPASYWLGGHRSSNDVFYVGTYPNATLVACDMKTGAVTSHGRVTGNEREKYIIRVAAADDGTVYSSVGLHHEELWSLNPETGNRLQILPDLLAGKQGAPQLWTGTDGHVYGRSGKTEYRCRPDGIEEGKTCPPRRDPMLRRAGDHDVTTVDDQGRLTLASVADGSISHVQTDYLGRAPAIFSVGPERDGRIYGGTVFPGRVFCYQPTEGVFEEVEQVTPGSIQIYDTFSHPKGLFFASYMGCILDFFDPGSPRKPRENPRRLKRSIPGHERPVQWELGPDGKLYFGTVPAKGRLGGALVRVSPDDFTVEAWEHVVPDQSIHYLVSVSETGELFGCASVGGGSSAIPKLDEAEVFLWDTKTENLTWRGTPVPGTRSYLRAVRTADGLIAGLAGESWYLFDPVKRETIHRGSLPVTRLHFPYLSDHPGPKGLLIGLGGDAVFAIDPEQRSAEVLGRHDSLNGAHGFCVAEDGWLYYGSGSNLWRCRLAAE